MANVSLSPISVRFDPLPEFKINSQAIAKKMSQFVDDHLSLSIIGVTARVSSYLVSPNVLIPLQMLEVLGAAYYNNTSVVQKTFNIFVSVIGLALVAKFTNDGTLHKLSNNLYTLASEADEAVLRVLGKAPEDVTYHEPPQISDNPERPGFIRSIINFINSIFRRIFNCFYSTKEKLTPA